MGLDQYAYVSATAENWDNSRELSYWRKHPNLQGWMRRLWESRGHRGEFNGDELELFWEDIDQLEKDIMSGVMADLETTGFFFGNASDDYYRDRDLEFVKNARVELFMGLRVFYNSSW